MIDSVRNNELERVIDFLDDGVDPNWKNNCGDTALIVASRYGYSDIAGILLDHKADPDTKDDVGDTALIVASRYGYTAIVGMLMIYGANPDRKNNVGDTAVIVASRYGYSDIVNLINKRVQVRALSESWKNILASYR